MGLINRWPLLVTLAAVLGSGCGRASPDAQPDAATSAQAPAVVESGSAAPAEAAGPAAAGDETATGIVAPTLAELAGGTYSGLTEIDGPITLVAGEWLGEPFEPGAASRPRVVLAPGFRLTGDLDSDGTDEAVVALAQSSGGSGTFNYLAAVRRGQHGVLNIATVPLGDRVAVRTARIDSGRLEVSVLRAGEGDARCCPGELAELAWTLGTDGLVPAESAGVTGRLSPDVLADSQWVLREWNPGEAAPPEPEVTLGYEAGSILGKSGCNRYSGTIEAGQSPGDLSIGPIAATRMACGDPADTIESRFLTQLDGVAQFGFLLGRLALTYRKGDGTVGTMLFEGRPKDN